MQADQLGDFGRFPPARQHRGVAIADNDNVADAGQVLGPHWPEKPSGDVVVVCNRDTAVLASRREPPEVAQLVGLHGGATDAEMAIPLITFRG